MTRKPRALAPRLIDEKTLIEVDEGQSVTVTATAGGAQKVFWIYKHPAFESVVATDRFSFTFNEGRVSHDAYRKLQFKAIHLTRHMEVNGYCLYGLPGESIRNIVETVLFISHVIGSTIPMLFSPVPSTQLFDRHKSYYQQQGWCDQTGMVRDLHLLNGKLFPFLPMNDGSIEDDIDLQRLMFTLNQSYRSKSFNVFGQSSVAKSFREVVASDQSESRDNTELTPTLIGTERSHLRISLPQIQA